MESKYNSVKKIVQKYGDIQLPHWISLSIWLVAVGVLLGLTIKDIKPIISDYQDEDRNVETQIQVVKNDTLRPPGLYLCIGYVPKSLIEIESGFHYNKTSQRNYQMKNCSACALLAENWWDISSDFDMSYPIGQFDIVSAIMKRLFANLTLMDEALKPRLSKWKLPIMDAVFMYFLELQNNDLSEIRDPQMENDSWNSYIDHIGWPENYKLEQLAKKFSQFICTYLTFGGISKNHALINATVCSENFLSPTFFLQSTGVADEHQLCLSLPTYVAKLDVYLQTSIDYSVTDFTSLYPQFYKSSRYSIFEENPLFFHLFSDTTPALYTSSNSDDDELVKVAYSVEVNVQEQRETKHCYKDQSQLTCIHRCLVEEMIEKCRCIPFTFRFLITDFNLPYCNASNYRNCGSKLNNDLENCKAKCKTACIYTSYRWQTEISRIVQVSGTRMPQLILKLNPLLSQFMQFTVSVRDGPQNLFSSVGGIFSFYTGVSGLTIFAVIIYTIESLRRIQRLRMQEETSSSNAPIHIWHWKWFSVTANMLKRQDSKDDTSLQRRVSDLERLLQEQQKVLEEQRMALQTQREEIDQMIREMSKIKRGNTEGNEENGQTVPGQSDIQYETMDISL